MVNWLYQMILKPRFLHAVVVWWSRTQLITVKEKLGQLQAMIFRGITGAMRTTPTAALGFMLAEAPLHIAAVKKAALIMSRLTAQGRWKVGGIHTKLPRSILSIPELSMVQDRMIKRVKFKPRFKIITPSRMDWKKGFPLGDEVWYTDGSKMDCGAGFGIYRKTGCIKVAESLGQHATVWQAEVCAILTCAQISIRNGTKGKRISICVDSQAALGALKNPTIESKLVWECRSVLDELGSTNRLSLIWVPGHSGIKGKERVDVLAKTGSETKFIGPEPAVAIMPCLVKGAIERWGEKEHEKYWANVGVGRQAKTLLGLALNKRRASDLLKLDKIRVRTVVRLLTGHGLLNYHQHKIGRQVSPMCRLCGESNETSTHILSECPALARIRLCSWGQAIIDPKQVSNLSIVEILDFWRRTGL
ncbi:uncharacterized protein LOC122510089 [Leptopilina heterotoma]|uniref:uncharacterized protein LOC122510089 n=1 Tax=Leptopilina heterotoma TaxID=63436 RepID=UPI001CA9E08C|nr:uncharacterized protein LOC122510089 [Leptopilina heterotoma]